MQTQTLPDGTQIVIVHYNHFVGGLGNGWHIACMPNMKEMHTNDALHPTFIRSNDKRAVTCPACKKSTVYNTSPGDINQPLTK